MSAFDTNAPATTEEEAPESYVAKLVETRGEQWSNPETIAKGKLEADAFIEDLKAQNEELRKEMKREEELSELIATIKAQNKAPTGEPEQTDEGQHTATPLGTDDTKALVEQLIAEREQTSQRQKNINEVDTELQKRYGHQAASIVKRTAEDLGMSVQEAQDLAATKPKAFFRLMGLDNANQQSPRGALTGGVLNTSAITQSNDTKNAAYFKKMKQEKGKTWYFSPAAQREMAEARAKLGSAFWET